MADHIKITPAEGTWVVRAGGAVLGESERALELAEGDYAPVIYFPRDDIAMAFLDKTDSTSTCPWKGDATYYSIVVKSGTIADAAWSYESPIDEVGEIAGYIAFYPDKAAVEQV
ncbi:DUF427 domain-containing protein [Pelagovum pacificum]|uniref:DUF427 domain-containing protein n=1 Tax=Pelagovum pacificum TaxID=2588711 RepID=A0A5C5GAY5_9RHOB|nr:DUF427 domain-containing protein [Pelagovum pacificum]QQA41829.1 DUF427 domain-containing protein [Pelagovum pacificum]TNY30727.1 DUF427 domain-containing protein [Pelagovum pacificum]